MNSRNAVKLACETGEILFTSRCIPQLLEKLENRLERLNTPLSHLNQLFTFRESTNENANLSLATGMGFSYCEHLVRKPKTYSFG